MWNLVAFKVWRAFLGSRNHVFWRIYLAEVWADGLDACGRQLVCVCPLMDHCSQVQTLFPACTRADRQTEALKGVWVPQRFIEGRFGFESGWKWTCYVDSSGSRHTANVTWLPNLHLSVKVITMKHTKQTNWLLTSALTLWYCCNISVWGSNVWTPPKKMPFNVGGL